MSVYDEVLRRDIYRLRLFGFDYFNTIVDIGAHHGTFSLLARAINPNARIVSFEPSPRTFKVFDRNTAGWRIQKYMVGLGNGSEGYINPTNKSDRAVVNYNQGNQSHIKVKMITFDELMKIAKPQGTSMLKVDCEGGETYIIGNENKLNKFNYIAIEVHYHHGIRKLLGVPDKNFWEEWAKDYAQNFNANVETDLRSRDGMIWIMKNG